jgi:hypothetical protein
MTVTVTGDGIKLFHLISQYRAIMLEGKGLRFKGGSIMAHCKRTYNLSGNRQKVLDGMLAMIQELDPGYTKKH